MGKEAPMEMKKSLAMILLFSLLSSCGGLDYRKATTMVTDPTNPFDRTSTLSKKDRFQAGTWVRLASAFVATGDYVAAWQYCENVLNYYPNTLYANEAREIESKIVDPEKNRQREYIKDNPGLFGGM